MQQKDVTANEIADIIADFIFAEKEFVLNALQTDDKESLRDEAYEYIGG